MKKFLFFLVGITLLSQAADEVTVELKMNDGELIPLVLEVPANKKIRIEIINIGKTPAEFESVQLVKEKVLAPGVKRVVVISPKKPGHYDFFDDFHLDKPKGTLLVK